MKLYIFYFILIWIDFVNSFKCSSNCSTSVNALNSSTPLVQCKTQKKSCDPIFGKNDGVPTKPDKISANWFLYKDPRDNVYQKVGLNFSWSPGDDYSIKRLSGYKISVIGLNTHITESKYFCLPQKLNYQTHAKIIFYFDSLGYCNNMQLLPGQVFAVYIRSLPEPQPQVNDQLLHFNISIPSCYSPTMKFVKKCLQKNSSLSIVSQSCKNRSIKIVYFMHKSNVTIMLGINKFVNSMPLQVDMWKKLPRMGSLDMNIPTVYSLLNNYTIVTWVEDEPSLRRYFSFSLSNCTNSMKSKNRNLNYIIIFPIIVLLSAAFICYYKRHLKPLIEKWFFVECCENALPNNPSDINVFEMSVPVPLTSKKRLKLFVLFVDDHPFHKEIVMLFSSYLEGDLGFNVTLELYQTNELSADPVDWMDRNLLVADKVIIVWSPGAAERWYMYNEKSTVKRDYFTPVLKNLYRDLFCGKNPHKYLFVYFDYCKKTDIPPLFLKKYPHLHFKLMQQIDEFYFRLQGIEKYAPGIFLLQKKVDMYSYFDPNVNIYGKALHNKICEMYNYVVLNPNWYQEAMFNLNKF